MTAHIIILDAAERVFGEHGFEGASMRQIANAAGVAQSLLHYHHKDKLSLFEAVFRRRADQIAERRGALLDDLITSVPDRSEDGLKRVLEVLLTPLDALLDIEGCQLHAYLQMLAETTLSSSERAVSIMQRFYDPSAARFITAFKAAVPGLDHEQAVWCYLFAIGARMQAHSPAARAERLGVDPAKVDMPYEMLVPFIAAGIRTVTKLP